MTKDHFVPQLILKNFADSEGNFRFYNKKNNSVSEPINYVGQLQKTNFYSRKSLNELKQQFSHIILNPLFEGSQNKHLEDALACVESQLGVVVKGVLELIEDGQAVTFNKKSEELIREYMLIQHIRTMKFKRLSREYNERFNFPPGVKEGLIERENSRNIQIRRLIKIRSPHLNSKERFKLEKISRKKLKTNPNLIAESRERFFEEKLDLMIQKAEEDLKQIFLHPEKHSADVIDLRQRNSFNSRCKVDEMNLVVVWNTTDTPFVLSDTGLIIMVEDPKAKTNLEIFLPISPKILLGLSKKLPKNTIVDGRFVNDFNRIAKEDSYKNIYSVSEKTLEALKN